MIDKLINNKMIAEMIQKSRRASVTDLLGEGVRINGTYTSAKNVRVIGSIEGNLQVDGDVYIEETGKVHGNVTGRSMDVSGTVEGDMISSGKVVVRNSAVIKGCLYTKALEIEADAIVEGAIFMSDLKKAGTADKVEKADKKGQNSVMKSESFQSKKAS